MAFGFLASRSVDTGFAAPCSTPGTDGPGGTLTGVVNTYYPGNANAAAGATSITVGTSTGAATLIAAGDLLLVIQVQDASLTTSNSGNYGDNTAGDPATGSLSLNNTGKYEYVRATGAVAAGAVPIAGAGAGAGLLNAYTDANYGAQGQRRFQVVRVPQYSSATLGSGLTASAWNGRTGGILAVDVTGTLSLGSATVDVSALGFRGGGGRLLQGAGGGSGLLNTDYRSLATLNANGQKGEGIAGTPRYVRNGVAAPTDTGVEGYVSGSSARGAPGNAGGGGTDGRPAGASPGGNDENAGGGGGANGGAGGIGGNTWNSNLPRGGFGGAAYPGSVSQLVLGAGGGAGSRNNSTGAASTGGNGGGMVLIRAGIASGTGTITANGQLGIEPVNDGGGGGGAGGTVSVLSSGGGLGGLTVNARGANGTNADPTGAPHGPGGGGGGGVVVLSQAAAAININGGVNGTTNQAGSQIAFGATPGGIGASTETGTLGAVPGVSSGTECAPVLTVTKTTSTPVIINTGSGGTATYTITVSNGAVQAPATSVAISDALPTGFTYASTGSVTLGGGATRPATTNPAVGATSPSWGTFTIPGGGSVQITFNASVAAAANGTYQNPATATYVDPGRTVAAGTTTSAYNSATSTQEDVLVRPAAADLAVTKIVSNATPVLNSNVTFTVGVSNAGPDTAQGVSVSDLLPGGLSFVSASPSVGTYTSGTGVWAVGNMNSATSQTLQIVATVTSDAAITNTATASSTTFDPAAANNTDSASVDVPNADLAVTKVVTDTTPALGSNVTFTVAVTNNGPDSAQAVSVADLLPGGLAFVSATPAAAYDSGTGIWTIGTLADGGTASLDIVATVNQHTAMTNTATVSSTTRDVVAGNNSESATVNVPDANLAITKTVDDASPEVGSNVTFTLTATNNGPSTAQSVSVADALPAGLTFVSATPAAPYNAGTGTWTVGNLASGASATLDIVATVTAPGAIDNTAVASSPTFDPTPADNTTLATVNGREANLVVTKTVDDTTPALDADVTFTVTVTNSGPDAASGVSVADALPAGLTLVSATPSTGSYAAGVWTVGNMANGASAAMSIVATVTTHIAVTNTATASSTTYDPIPGNNAASASVNVPDADVALTKSVDNATPDVGDNVTFTVTVTNNGPNTAQAVSVQDALPVGLTYVSSNPSAGTYNSGTGAWTIGNLTNGATVTLDIVATVTVPAARTNTATATSTTFDPFAGDNSDAETVDARDADLAVSKSVDTATPSFGGQVTFLVTVTNAGPDTSSGVSVADPLPPGLSLVTATPSQGIYSAGVWNAGVLANGATETLEIVAQVNSHLPITNTATVSATTHDPNAANDTDSASVDVPDADLAVVKTVDSATPAVGTDATFTVTVINNGANDTTGVSVVDALPTGLTFVSASSPSYDDGTGIWSVGNLADGASTSLTIVATVDTHSPITNTATVSSVLYDPVAANDTDGATVDAPNADLVVDKTVSTATPAFGANVTFTVTVTNNGPDTAAAVSVIDALPAGLTLVSATPAPGTYVGGLWTVGSLVSGDSATLTVVATADTHLAVTNTATASSGVYDPDTANNADSATVNVPDADLDIVKTVSDATPAINANVAFTVAVTNTGPNASYGVSVADALPPGLTFVSANPAAQYDQATGVWTIGALANGATATLDIVATVIQHTPVTNTASVSSSTYDPNGANNSDGATADVPNADLAVTKTVDNPGPNVGDNVTFTVTVTNNGPDTAQAVSVGDSLPAGLTFVSANPAGAYDSGTGVWTVGDLTNTQTATLEIVATVVAPGSLVNTATATSSTFDPSGANSASASVNALPADLSIVKSVSNAAPALGDNVTFTVTVTNNGPQNATGVSVADSLPAGLTFVSANPAAPYDAGTGIWTIGTLANGETSTLEVTATVNDPALLTNIATVSATTYDPSPANNSDDASVDVPEVDLVVTNVVDDATPALNSNVVFTVAVTNSGPDAAEGVTVTDLLPAGLTFVSSDAGASYDPATGVWSVGGLASGVTRTIQITATVIDAALLTATAAAASTTLETNPADNGADATVDVPEADVAVTNTVDNTTPALGQNVVFTVTVTNNGPLDATGVTVSDLLPAGLVFVSSDAGPAYDPGSGVWSVGNLANGATATIQITSTVTSPTPQTTTATVTSVTYDGNAANNSADVIVDVPEADLVILKTVSDATPALGDNVTFTLNVTNSGPSSAQAVQVTDALPAGLTLVSASSASYVGNVWTVGDLANGAGASLDIVAQVTDAAPITNTATVTSATHDPAPADNNDSVTVDVPQADLTLAKSVDDATPNQGQNVTYTLRLSNNGPDASGAVVVRDLLPAELTFVSASADAGTFASGVWTLASVPSGASRDLRIVARVDVQGPITNSAQVTASATFDPTSTPGDGIGDDAASVNIDALPASADLALTMGASSTTPSLGGSLTYTLTLVNNGPSATDGVSVLDVLPASVTFSSASASRGAYDAGSGTWTVGPMSSGDTVTLSIVVIVNQAGALVNTAEVGSSSVADPDSAPANGSSGEDDQAATQVTVQGATVAPTVAPASANLEIIKSASTPRAQLGDTVSYAIVVTNRGPDAATNVQVLEQLPSALQFVSARASVGAYDVASFVWSIPAIPNGGSASLIVTTRVVAPGSVTNTVQILASDQPDPDGPFSPVLGGADAGTASATVAVSGPAPTPTRLAITKSGTKVVKAGGTVRFTIVIRNSGAVPATNVLISDCVPSGLSLRGRVAAGRLRKNGRIGWQIGTLQPGQSRVVRVVLRADRDTRGMHGCAAVASAANAPTVRAGARVRVIAGVQVVTGTAVAG